MTMMIEKEIENAVVSQIKSKLEAAEIDNIQVSGLLGTTTDTLKGEEDGEKSGYIFVKASPRQYETPTVPECQVNVRVVMTVRADEDWNGKTYLDLFEMLMGTFEKWQKCMDDVHTLFTFDNYFVQGYVLGPGDAGLDQTKKVWTYTHDMTLYGVIVEPEV